MNNNTRPYDTALYESMAYGDRIAFDQYDLAIIYVETSPNVDILCAMTTISGRKKSLGFVNYARD